MAHRVDKGRGRFGFVQAEQGIRVGPAGVDIKGLIRFSPVLSPAIVAANTVAESAAQTVTGLAVGGLVIQLLKPTAQAGLRIGGLRVAGANELPDLVSDKTA